MQGRNTLLRYETKLLLVVAALALFYDSSGWAFVMGFLAFALILKNGKAMSVKNLWWIVLSGVSSLIGLLLEIGLFSSHRIVIQQCVACALLASIASSLTVFSEEDKSAKLSKQQQQQETQEQDEKEISDKADAQKATTLTRKSNGGGDGDDSSLDSPARVKPRPLTLDQLLSPERRRSLEESAREILFHNMQFEKREEEGYDYGTASMTYNSDDDQYYQEEEEDGGGEESNDDDNDDDDDENGQEDDDGDRCSSEFSSIKWDDDEYYDEKEEQQEA